MMKNEPKAREGRVVLVTGAGSGIGRSIARNLARRGDTVWICGRREEPLKRLAAESPQIRPYRADITDSSARRALIDAIEAECGRLDVLINNAGVQNPIDLTAEIDEALIENEIAANLTAPIVLSALAIELLRKSQNARIINISSGLAIAPKASAPVYCATKAGLSNFSLGLGFQVEALGIAVVDVVTPLVKTPMTEGRNDGAIEPDEFADAVIAAIDRPRPELYVGQSRLLAMLMRVAPGRAKRILKAA